MRKRFAELTVLSQEEISSELYLARLELPRETVEEGAVDNASTLADKEPVFVPGNFLMLRCEPAEPYRLMRPMSVLACDDDDSRIDIFYRVVGDQTKKLSLAPPGMRLPAVFPLGNRFVLPPDKNTPTVLVAGGVGLPPLLFLASHMAASGYPKPELYFGASDRAHLAINFVELWPANFNFATDDGSHGFHGSVVDLLASDGLPEDARVYACGPRAMLQALQALCRTLPPASCQASLEEMMACGTGACYGCAVAFEGEGVDAKKLVCRDGPVFELAQVRFD